ncbi:NAD(P)-binding domain-containing protein [Granulicella tundricola]|uniref:FAD-dependent pyridine nucleotide-disulfide oxidoreductase n=1 Tax=Granulicella tundricola (strain ATCC BAA-1859 / DSM 23138 / MP5ACTX9) TaxID=1198114 RepID=E8X6S9_GRATM|nr:NAD(P)/FAD-dependent oxidoreductase [Granulicella tundricola]ADW71229.1 FAD-dependent pyridine nucleotide-disulfide oxidoreductase [Granulicella tundricola MP5ACTX9]
MRSDHNDVDELPVVVVGAGPYGLSIAAHLAEACIPFRIFGGAMQMWREHMPAAMTMKSDGFASNLSAGSDRSFTFRQFCKERGLPYVDRHFPMPLKDFVAYGLEFQKRFVPQLDPRHVTRVERHEKGFKVVVEDGEFVVACGVICATGVMHYPYLPEPLKVLHSKLVTHSSEHTEFSEFAGLSVAVIGAGSSAMHTAALLSEAGAEVTVVTRRSKIIFHDSPTGGRRSLVERVLHPTSKLGPGLRSFFAEHAPLSFHRLPVDLRLKIVQKHLGPSSAGHLRSRVEGKAKLLLQRQITSAKAVEQCVQLELEGPDGRETIDVRRVVAATGYHVDLKRLRFLEPLLKEIECNHKSPLLDHELQSSVPGLYFVGLPAAASFGPLLRFAAGSAFAARTITQALS